MYGEPLFDAEDDARARPRRQGRVPDFDRQRMVEWFNPGVLVNSGIEVLVSDLFARFVDKREVQAGLPAKSWRCDDSDVVGDFWIDFASDTGDGYVTVAPIASLLSRGITRTEVTPADGVPGLDADLPQGQLLILGGDQVYPSATWRRYQDRFVGPFTEAYPDSDPDRPAPRMFALPGNHDWYDGLTSFMRLFCQQAWIGGWRTNQTRSYFAIRLPRKWWLWGIDTQFETYIDGPQLDYFQDVSDRLEPGDRVILATAKPSWVLVPPEGEVPEPWRTLAFFEQKLIAEAQTNETPDGKANPAKLALTLTGDLHHYSRYSEAGEGPDRQHKITAGGAGAFLSGTHFLKPALDLPRHSDLSISGERGSGVAYCREQTWPSVSTAEKMRKGVWNLPVFALAFGILTGAIYALFAVALTGELDGSGGLGDTVGVWPILLAVLLGLGLLGYALSGDVKGPKLALVGFHWLLHLVPLIALTLLLNDAGLARGWIVLAAFGLGFFWGRVAMAIYFYVASIGEDRAHATEVFAAQSRHAGRGYKHFLRLRIAKSGKLTAFAIGMKDPVKHEQDIALFDRVDIPAPPAN